MKLSISATLFLFLELIILIVITANGIWGVSEVWERNIYLISAVFIWIFGVIGSKIISRNSWKPTMLTLGLLTLTSQIQVPHDLLPLQVAGGLLINQVILLLFLRRYGKFPKTLDYFMSAVIIVLLLLVVQAFYKNNVDVQYFFIFSKDVTIKSIIPTIGLLFSYFIISKLTAIGSFRKILFLVTILVITGISLVATLPYNYRHHSFFLGPLLKIASGGTMLVNTYSQYGAGIFYFLYLSLKLVNLGITYTGLGFITSLFQVFSFFTFFTLCYFIFHKNLSLAILITAVAILAQFYLPIGIPTFFPSTGVFRFGLIYIIAISFAIAKKYLNGWKGQIYSGLIVGATAIWSLDILPGTLYIFGVIQLLDYLENKSVLQVVKAFIVLGISTIAITGLFTLYTFLRSGSLPNIIPYLAYLRLYADGYNLLPMPGFGVWWLFLMIYAISILWSCRILISSKNNQETTLARTVLLITAAGIGIFPYYVGRSHPNNLYHVSLPLIFLTGFWIWKNRYIRILGITLLSFFITYEVNINIDSIKEKFATTALGVTISSWPQTPWSSVANAISSTSSQDRNYWYTTLPVLKNMDLTKVNSIATLLPYNRATGILSILDKNNLTTVTGDPEEDLFAWPELKPLVLKQVEKMSSGDLYIGYSDECSLYITDMMYTWNESHLQEVYNKLASTYDYKKLAIFEDITILEVVGPKTNDSQFNGFPSLSHLPTLYSVNPNVLTRTGNLENKFQINLSGTDFTPTTIVNVGFSKLKTQYKDTNNLSAELPELLLNKPGLYKITLSNCKGGLGSSTFLVK